MKKFFVISMAVLAIISLTACFCLAQAAGVNVVCNPQSDADGYNYVLDGGTPTDVPYTTITLSDSTVAAKILDVTNLAPGSHTLNVYAYKVYPAPYGRKASATVPFNFTIPSQPASPAGVRLGG